MPTGLQGDSAFGQALKAFLAQAELNF